MKFAIVELKYMEKKFFIVRDDYMKKSNKEDRFCYISTDLTEEPNFQAKYFEKWEGVPGMFKVFVTKITNSLDAAISFLNNHRLKSVPKKLRGPANTDSELAAEETKRKRNEKRIQKDQEENAHIRNTSHLAALVKDQAKKSAASNYESLVKTLFENSDSESVASDTNEDNGERSHDNASRSAQVDLSNYTNPEDEYQTVINREALTINPNEKVNTPLSVRPTVKTLQNNTVARDNTKKCLPLAPSNMGKKEKHQASQMTRNEYQTVLDRKALSVNPNEKVKTSLSVRSAVKTLQTNTVAQDNIKNCLPLVPSNVDIKENHQAIPSSTPKGEIARSVKNLSAAKSIAQAVTILPFKVPESANVVRQSPTGAGMRYLNDTETLFSNGPKNMSKKRKVLSTSFENNNIVEPISQNKQPKMLAKIKNQEVGTDIDSLKHENTQLKVENENLRDRNNALQIALVQCTKAIPLPPLNFEEKDGGRLYSCGIYLHAGQCKVLDAIRDDRQYCNALILSVFGSDTLKLSSVKGTRSNRTKAPAKFALDPIGLKFIYDTMAIRTANLVDFTPTKINSIINKKIANLLAPAKPRIKQPRKMKGTLLADNNELNEEIDVEENDYDENNVEKAQQNHEVNDETDEDDDRVEEDIEIGDYEEVEDGEGGNENQIEANLELELEVDECGQVINSLNYQQQSNEGNNGNDICLENSFYILDLPVLSDLSDIHNLVV